MSRNANGARAHDADPALDSSTGQGPGVVSKCYPSGADERVDAARTFFDALGFEDDELHSVSGRDPGGRFVSRIFTTSDLPDVVAACASRDCWVGGAVLREGIPHGARGSAADVRGVRVLSADLDVKAGGLSSFATGEQVIADLRTMLGVQPAAVVMTGHGLQPHWLLERDEGTDWSASTDPAAGRVAALVRRWGRLVAHVAERHGGTVDSTFDPARVWRVPGTTNLKGTPVTTTVAYPGGSALSLDRLADTLDEYGVPELAEDREVLDAVVVDVAGWTFSEDATCAYVTTMVDSWGGDKPAGRHPWLVGQAVRLAAAHRLGCLTEEDHRGGVEALGARFRTRLNVGAKRKESPGEVSGALAWGRQKASTFTDDRCREELGGHVHEGKPEPVVHDAVALEHVHAAYRKWMGPEYELDVLDVVLAVAAAGMHLPGDPAWLLVNAGSGNGKTETIAPLAAAGAVLASSLKGEASLLSGTSKKERSKDSTGGLLRTIGDSGILVFKDFTSIISMDRHTRAEVLSALREIYDGRWDRIVGAEGGRTLTWTGRCVVIGATTNAFDAAHGVISSMGDRFLLVRPKDDGARAAGASSLRTEGREEEMRAELGAAVGGLLQHLDAPETEQPTPKGRILDLADVVTWMRTAVDTDFKGDVLGPMAREAPTRFAKQLQAVYRGARLIGLGDEAATRLVVRVARDSIPPRRRDVMAALLAAGEPLSVSRVAEAAGLPRATVPRHLDALFVLGLVTRHSVPTSADVWGVADGLDLPTVRGLLCLPARECPLYSLSASSALTAPPTTSTTFSKQSPKTTFPGRVEAAVDPAVPGGALPQPGGRDPLYEHAWGAL